MAGLLPSTYNSDNSAVVVRIVARGIGLSDERQRSEEQRDPAEQAQPKGQGAP